MAILLLFSWWYSQGWIGSYKRILDRPKSILAEFSVPLLIKTLFEPWKQLTSYAPPTASLEQKLRAFFDNTFARFMGFMFRSLMIIIAIVISSIVILLGLLIAIVWPVIPLSPLLLIVMSLM